MTTTNQTIRNELRAQARAARAALTPEIRAYKSDEICKQLAAALDITVALSGKPAQACTVAVYSAFPEEVNLHYFIEHAYDTGCTVAFPCMMHDAQTAPANTTTQQPSTQTMEMRIVPASHYRAHTVTFLNNPLKRFEHASAELKEFPYIPGNELTMIVVPVVGFDNNNMRLGYGKGNYDRYLTQLAANCRMVGVAFEEQRVSTIPAEAHDIPLPIVAV